MYGQPVASLSRWESARLRYPEICFISSSGMVGRSCNIVQEKGFLQCMHSFSHSSIWSSIGRLLVHVGEGKRPLHYLVQLVSLFLAQIFRFHS